MNVPVAYSSLFHRRYTGSENPVLDGPRQITDPPEDVGERRASEILKYRSVQIKFPTVGHRGSAGQCSASQEARVVREQMWGIVSASGCAVPRSGTEDGGGVPSQKDKITMGPKSSLEGASLSFIKTALWACRDRLLREARPSRPAVGPEENGGETDA